MSSDPPSTFPPPTPPSRALSLILHRETVRLVVLIAVAVATVFATRSLADSMRRMERAEAAEWYRRATEALERGDLDAAVEDFRRAVARQRDEKRYVLGLANVLARTDNHTAAERALLRIRAAQPEDPEINVALARVAGARDEVPTAVRYYHNALYGPWQSAEGPRAVRLELIRFLIDRGDSSRAVSELIAASLDVPSDPSRHVAIARLFSEAGDERRALEEYQRALKLSPRDPEALAGAGLAAFAIGEYDRARTYLKQADGTPAIESARAIAGLVVSRDPFAPRIGVAERRRRLLANIDYARRRAEDCIVPHAADAGAALLGELEAIRPTRRRIRDDSDAIEAALALLIRIEREAGSHCPPTTAGRALLLIAERHDISAP